MQLLVIIVKEKEHPKALMDNMKQHLNRNSYRAIVNTLKNLCQYKRFNNTVCRWEVHETTTNPWGGAPLKISKHILRLMIRKVREKLAVT